MISSGLEFDEAIKQPKIKKLQIDISNDSKNEVSKKIKDLNEKDFQKLDTKGDGNCLLSAILKSTGNNELRFPELRQLVSDIIENSNLSEVGRTC